MNDRDRPLNERGNTDAPRMGRRLKERDLTVDLIISSPARRTQETAKALAAILGYHTELIKTIDALYHADEDTLIRTIRNLPDVHDCIMLVGHNPGLTDFVNAMQLTFIDNVPTCGVASLSFTCSSWKEVEPETGTLNFYDYPKSRKD